METPTEHSPADMALIEEMKRITQEGPHASDPRTPAVELAAALIAWFEA
ncbi:MAG: hypothetical protein V4645_18215 [Pseudomonadota bacterium]